MQKNKKKTVLVVTVIALVALLAIGATLALLSDEGTITNLLGIGRGKDGEKTFAVDFDEPDYRIQVGEISDRDPVDGEIATTDPETNDKGAIEFNPDKSLKKVSLFEIVPGDTLIKDPTITVKGKTPSYLRMKAEVVKKDGAGGTVKVNAFEEPLLTGGITAPPADVADGLGLKVAANWEKHGTGANEWYYYVDGAGVSEEVSATTPATGIALFAKHTEATGAGDKFTLKIPLGWTYKQIDQFGDTGLEIIVTMQAVQSGNVTPDLAAADPWKDVSDVQTWTYGN